MTDPDDIAQQQALLASQRRTLGHLLRQRALHGAAHAPPATLNGIDEARAAIQRIKAYLRAHGIAVDDHADDEEHAEDIGSTQAASGAVPPTVNINLQGDFRAANLAFANQTGRDIAQGAAGRSDGARTPTCPAPSASRLFGRDAIRDEIIAQLCGSAESVAISAVRGLPGVGKTDLVRAIGTDQRTTTHFDGGVLYAELGPAPDLSLVLRRWLIELGVEPPPRDEPTTLAALLRQTLAPRRALLILDDVWDSSVLVATALRDCAGPGCRVLASSRSPDVARALGRGAEPLPLDVLDDDPALEMLRQHAPAVVAADESGARTLAEALGRLPLALKLAGTLLANDRRNPAPCATLLATWRARLDKLRGYETRPGREQGDKETRSMQFRSSPVPQFQSSAANDQLSLDAIIGMSYDALPNDDIRAAAAALAAFGATPLDWDWDAMAALWQTDEEQTGEWERALVGSGMLEWDAPTRRYSLHQTVHAFLERRADPAAYEWHAAYYADLMRRCNQEIEHESTIDSALATLDQEIAQIERGQAWAVQAAPSPEHDTLLILYGLLCETYFRMRGRYEQSIDWSETGQQAAVQQGLNYDAASLLGNIGNIYESQGQYEEAIEYHQRSLTIKEDIGDHEGTAMTLSNLGIVYEGRNRYDEAIQHYQHSLEIAERTGNVAISAALHWNLGMLYEDQGRLAEALPLIERAAEIAERIGMPQAEKYRAEVEALRARLAGPTG